MIFLIYAFYHVWGIFFYIYTLKSHEFCETLSKLLSLLLKTSHKRAFLFCEILIFMWDLIINDFLIYPCWKRYISMWDLIFNGFPAKNSVEKPFFKRFLLKKSTFFVRFDYQWFAVIILFENSQRLLRSFVRDPYKSQKTTPEPTC